MPANRSPRSPSGGQVLCACVRFFRFSRFFCFLVFSLRKYPRFRSSRRLLDPSGLLQFWVPRFLGSPKTCGTRAPLKVGIGRLWSGRCSSACAPPRGVSRVLTALLTRPPLRRPDNYSQPTRASRACAKLVESPGCRCPAPRDRGTRARACAALTGYVPAH